MVGFALAHSESGAWVLRAGILMALWVCVAAAWLILRLVRRVGPNRQLGLLVGLTAAVVAMPFIPGGFLQRPMVWIWGPGPYGDELLFNSAATHQYGLVRTLLAKGVDINAVGEDSGTALSAAAVEGDSVMLAYLLSHGANLTGRPDSGSHALEGALDMRHPAMAVLLLRQGAKPVCFPKKLAAMDSESATSDSGLRALLHEDDSTIRVLIDRDSRLQDSLLAALNITTPPCGEPPAAHHR